VAAIFAALPGAGQPAHIEWPIRVMAHLGLICEEIADATTFDVERVGGLVVLHIRADHRVMAGGRKNELKTIQRARSLPLPPSIAESFWEYASSLPPGPLFPGIAPDRDGLRSNKIGAAVRKFIRSLGISGAPYSFRNRFHTAMEGMPDLKKAREHYICGHTVEDVHDAYKDHPPHKTYPFICRFNPLVLSDPPTSA
jgi:integrase